MYSFSRLKICFVGIGSIASQHIRDLHTICSEIGITVSIDALRRPGGSARDPYADTLKYITDVYNNVEDLPADYDIIFITSPTDMHMEHLRLVHEKGKHFFIEKPIVSVPKVNEVMTFPVRTNSIYYVACPMRYRKVIQYIKKSIEPKSVIGVRSICSSYLPEWRPGTDYRKCYSAIKALGGGVSIDLIHEWDYLIYLFGFPKQIFCSFTKKSNLEMDVEDYASYIAEYSDKMVELHLDYYGRESLREIMLFTEADTIIGDFLGSKVTYLKSGKEVAFPKENGNNMRCELIHFLDIIDGKTQNDNDMKTAYKTLMLTQGVLDGGM